VEPRLAEFLRYVLSRDGQRVVAEDGGYLPLPAEVARAERGRLE
jgi:phosphate transport system substrate-binding protein